MHLFTFMCVVFNHLHMEIRQLIYFTSMSLYWQPTCMKPWETCPTFQIWEHLQNSCLVSSNILIRNLNRFIKDRDIYIYTYISGSRQSPVFIMITVINSTARIDHSVSLKQSVKNIKPTLHSSLSPHCPPQPLKWYKIPSPAIKPPLPCGHQDLITVQYNWFHPHSDIPLGHSH